MRPTTGHVIPGNSGDITVSFAAVFGQDAWQRLTSPLMMATTAQWCCVWTGMSGPHKVKGKTLDGNYFPEGSNQAGQHWKERWEANVHQAVQDKQTLIFHRPNGPLGQGQQYEEDWLKQQGYWKHTKNFIGPFGKDHPVRIK
jgi:hypothetical protein